MTSTELLLGNMSSVTLLATILKWEVVTGDCCLISVFTCSQVVVVSEVSASFLNIHFMVALSVREAR